MSVFASQRLVDMADELAHIYLRDADDPPGLDGPHRMRYGGVMAREGATMTDTTTTRETEMLVHDCGCQIDHDADTGDPIEVRRRCATHPGGVTRGDPIKATIGAPIRI